MTMSKTKTLSNAGLIWRCAWRFRVLGPLTEKGRELSWIVGAVGLMLSALGVASGLSLEGKTFSQWILMLMIGMPTESLEVFWGKLIQDPTSPWMLACWAALAIRCRWLVLGMACDARAVAAQGQIPNGLFWVAAPWIGALAANWRSQEWIFKKMRVYASSSRALPSQVAVGALGLVGLTVILFDTLAVLGALFFAWFVGAIVIVDELSGRGSPGTLTLVALLHGPLMLIMIRQGLGNSLAAWAKNVAAQARQKREESKRHRGAAAWALQAKEWLGQALSQAKSSVAKGLMASAASDGTLSQAELQSLDKSIAQAKRSEGAKRL